MKEHIFTIIIILIIFIPVFMLIKHSCYPIKTLPAILLTPLSIATCGIAIVIYKFIKGQYGVTSTTNYSSYESNNYYEPIEEKKEEKKKVARSYNDNFGKTTFYDDTGNIIGEGYTDASGKTRYKDSNSNYVGESYDNGMGDSIYTSKDGNVVTNTTNYLGDDNFSDGTTTTSDNFGNKYYH